MTKNKNKRILIIDDDNLSLEMMNEGLKPLGYPIDMAPDGTIALNMATSKVYDLIITDWFMNVMDGNDFVKRLRQIPKYKSTPIIFVTSNKNIDAVKQAKDLGIAKYFVKPINITSIREFTQKML